MSAESLTTRRPPPRAFSDAEAVVPSPVDAVRAVGPVIAATPGAGVISEAAPRA
ncbi:hypothetical protein AHOG_12250 [Actinoalloteichus hoggarensis]|uniref:Uncharacterized protein n=2 Tax=Actinoalloteichus hoggarensis TaxID=1470176 RepID=A0A221W308_9PSEU|nr:hypothetical protein AHOG_12250 [Actinoalloteichus hoggarensis]